MIPGGILVAWNDKIYLKRLQASQILLALVDATCYRMRGMARKMETQMQAELGPKRFGRFYLQELLNNGGMADIWLVTDDRSKPYALRKLRDNLRFNFLARKRFNHGCQVLSVLK